MVLGIASKNHKARPFKNPFPSALTMSLTIEPSSLATMILNTVLKIRNPECRTTMPASGDLHEGMAIRNKIERSWERNERSMLGLTDSCGERSGK